MKPLNPQENRDIMLADLVVNSRVSYFARHSERCIDYKIVVQARVLIHHVGRRQQVSLRLLNHSEITENQNTCA